MTDPAFSAGPFCGSVARRLPAAGLALLAFSLPVSAESLSALMDRCEAVAATADLAPVLDLGLTPVDPLWVSGKVAADAGTVWISVQYLDPQTVYGCYLTTYDTRDEATVLTPDLTWGAGAAEVGTWFAARDAAPGAHLPGMIGPAYHLAVCDGSNSRTVLAQVASSSLLTDNNISEAQSPFLIAALREVRNPGQACRLVGSN